MRRAVVICPGRGTYNTAELGYLARHFPDPALLAQFDAERAAAGQTGISALDGAARFDPDIHGHGDAAAALIFAASLGDFQAIDRDRIEVVAVTGNSMGWYSALACAGALPAVDGFRLANTMGTLMQQAMIGGQIVQPVVGDDWRPDPARKAALMALVAQIDARADHVLALSIDLGGMLVLAGNEAGLRAFADTVPGGDGRFPMRLPNHAAFHTALQQPVAVRGRGLIPSEGFAQPDLPLIDGRGAIWWPGASNRAALWDYTLGAQVVQPYDFTRAVTVAAREFAPDLFIVTGPGTTLGGAVAQSLIAANWAGIDSKPTFQARQSAAPVLAAMGRADQRGAVTR